MTAADVLTSDLLEKVATCRLSQLEVDELCEQILALSDEEVYQSYCLIVDQLRESPVFYENIVAFHRRLRDRILKYAQSAQQQSKSR